MCEDGEHNWYSVKQRALLPIEGIHVSKSLAKFMKNHRFLVTFDQDLEGVMRGCMRPETWISEEIIAGFLDGFQKGLVHSCEVWNGDRLVGGVYGIGIGLVFSAESMFHSETNASKIALWAMVNRCRELGFQTFDAQIMNPHLKSLGAYEVTSDQYMRLLRQNGDQCTDWSLPPSQILYD